MRTYTLGCSQQLHLIRVVLFFLFLQFVNNAFEKLTGYMASDVVGTEIQTKLQVDNCNEEETLIYHMKKYQVSVCVLYIS